MVDWMVCLKILPVGDSMNGSILFLKALRSRLASTLVSLLVKTAAGFGISVAWNFSNSWRDLGLGAVTNACVGLMRTGDDDGSDESFTYSEESETGSEDEISSCVMKQIRMTNHGACSPAVIDLGQLQHHR